MTDQVFLKRYGPTAIVLGASSGIGEQFARLLAERGLDLVLVARRKERIEALAAELSERHGVASLALPLDLAQPNFLGALLPACEDSDIGLVVSNAGAGPKGPLHENSRFEIEHALDLNCRVPLLLAHHFAPEFAKRGRGGILITGSIEGFQSFPYSAAYSATKAFVRSFGEAIWEEYRGRGVDVLVLAPGATDTEMLENLGLDAKQMRAMSAREVAESGLRQLGRGPTYIPGAKNRIFVSFLNCLPRRLALRIAGQVMQNSNDKARPARRVM
ncbi:MAG: SDR family NAD(P)-dependent oxidoreductase [Deltaproteobacteria bacterium]|nr:SDR family NAD(P)-dependent oxidoreductase [Deltaproteobacteria bacterium]MBW2726152.1 SDR family NAD(P)-dependent oxidoreductase [Deltaproteobacteria bacterium]